MSVTLKRGLASVASAAALSFALAAPASAQQMGGVGAPTEESYNAVNQCIDTNPDAPQACIRDVLESSVPEDLRQLEENMRAELGESFNQQEFNALACVVRGMPAVTANHYNAYQDVYEKGSSQNVIFQGTDEEYSGFKSFIEASFLLATDCFNNDLDGGYAATGLPSVEEALNMMDMLREQATTPAPQQ